MNVHGLQIREPRFDSGRRLQLITLKINLMERSQAPRLSAASATLARRKPPEKAPKRHRKVTVTRVDVMGCTWTQDFSFSSATIHAAFASLGPAKSK